MDKTLAPYTIVLASAGFRKAVAMARSLKRYGAKVLGVTNHVLEPCRFSRYFDHIIVLSGVDRESSSWAIYVAKASLEYGADLVIPVDFVDVVSFSTYSSLFDRLNIKLAAPSIDAVLRVSRKDKLDELVGDVIRVPRFLLYTSPEEINMEDVKSLRLPLVVKGIGDRSNPEYFSTYELAVERAKKRTPCIIQEYVAGVGRGYYTVAFNGEVLLEFTHERIYEADPSGGGSMAAKGPILDPKLFGLGRELVRRLNWTGPLMVETRWVPSTGEYYLLELNPKFWGSLPLPVSLGYHFPVALALAYLKGLDSAKDFCNKLLVRGGEYYFLLDGLYYLFRIPRVWISMLVNSKIVKSELDLLDPARVVMQLMSGTLGEIRSRSDWVRGLVLSMLRLREFLKNSQAPIAGAIFDLDGTLVTLRVPWLEVRRTLESEGLLHKWESLREGFARLWYTDRNLYSKASAIVEKFELMYLHNVKVLANIDELNNLRERYELTYCLVTFQSESVAKALAQKIGLRVDLVLGRDSGFSPLKENLYRECTKAKYVEGKYIVLDDDLVNVVNALRMGYLPIWVTKSKYEKVKSLRLGIPFTEPQNQHLAMLSLLKLSRP